MVVMGDIPKIVIKTIVLTYVLLVVGCLYIEYCNISLYAPYINQYSRISVRKSCEYFSSESYRNNRSLVKITDAMIIKDDNGNIYHNASFYDGKTEEKDIYEYLYKDNVNWRDWTTTIHKPNTTEPAMSSYKYWGDKNGSDTASFDTSICMGMYYLCSAEAKVGGMREYIGNYYRDSCMTPLNLGIPYIGEVKSGVKNNAAKSLESMCQWTLTKLLIAGNTACIKDDYVLYNGFRVYTKELSINNIDYTLCEFGKDDKAYADITNIEPGNLNRSFSSSGNYSIVDAVEFSVPVVYEGVTPFRRICSWIMTGGGFDVEDEIDSDGVVRTGGYKGANGWNGFQNGTRLEKDDLDSDAFALDKQEIGAFYGNDGRVRVGDDSAQIDGYSSSKLVYYLVH